MVYKYGPIEPRRIVMYGVVRPRELPLPVPFPDFDKIIRRGKLSKAFKKALDTYLDILCEAEKIISSSKLSKGDKNKLKKSLNDCLGVLIKLEEMVLSENTGLADVLKLTSEFETGLSKFVTLKKID